MSSRFPPSRPLLILKFRKAGHPAGSAATACHCLRFLHRGP